MPITIGPIILPRSAAELLDPTDGYGPGALCQLESASLEAGPYTFVASEAIVAGVDAIYFRDAVGTSDTWYRSWLSKAAGLEPSERSEAFQVTEVSGYTDLQRVKRHAAIGDTADDQVLVDYVAAVNREITRRIGIFLGPSSDTLRVYDGHTSVRQGYRIWIPGGIRTLTQVRTRETWGGTWTTRTVTDFALGPSIHGLAEEPYRRVDVSPYATPLPRGTQDVELTGTFGPAAVFEDLAKLADTVIVRMWLDRAASIGAPTPSKYIFADDATMLDQYAHDWVGFGFS